VHLKKNKLKIIKFQKSMLHFNVIKIAHVLHLEGGISLKILRTTSLKRLYKTRYIYI